MKELGAHQHGGQVSALFGLVRKSTPDKVLPRGSTFRRAKGPCASYFRVTKDKEDETAAAFVEGNACANENLNCTATVRATRRCNPVTPFFPKTTLF
jgi:uncharacterized membrane protein